MRALQYFFTEACASLWRSRGAATVAIATIAMGLFVLGVFLLLNANLQRVVDRWSESAELSVFLADDVTAEQLKAIDEMVAGSRLASTRAYVSKTEALERFRADFPDLAGSAASLSSNPLPASFELRLRPEAQNAPTAVEGLVTSLSGMAGVIDVRYDRDWLARLNTVVRGARIAGAVIVALLAIAAATTVANVVRLAAAARRDEIEIMQLVGAPFAYVRGPFLAEGILQGGIGAAVALAVLAGVYAFVRMRFAGDLIFLSVPFAGVVLLGGMAVGCLGGYAVARRVR
ncbi:MAG TPA: permease-like cell division protein FtsX [Vicinamibacterales bacterium]